ncbi:hypothetical protein B7755_014620 [Streptomyces sp. NBS 14/10]|uniref:hypothetical protein n=1 Tax=Streptomyces sp. NBS 14/10 TaxID=1945643 RepID=UPI0015C5C03A|nr:hypothetical protein [Streptomyces sp. NBS 14/10]KAK1179269.1 hypothetical protein B7755_014620 [Streptomyces sp. NBS 14/10]
MRAPRTLKSLAVRAALGVGTALLVPAAEAAGTRVRAARLAAGPAQISYDIQSRL